ncbi:MAG: hypothetical protein I4N51_07450 [Acinetobacter sp.]|nr:hypothetical protein [Acinetobacter sp.]
MPEKNLGVWGETPSTVTASQTPLIVLSLCGVDYFIDKILSVMRVLLHTFLIWVVYLLTPAPVLAQDKFSISLSAAPSYRYASTHFSSTFSVINGGMPVDVRIRQSGQVYSLGIMARYMLSKHFSIATGIWRNYISYQLPTITTIPDLSANPNDPQIIGIASHKRNYQLPVLISYQSSFNRLSPYFSVGGLVDFPSITVFENGDTGKTPNQDTRVYPTVGAGIIYQVSNKFSLIAQPTFTYFLPKGTFINYLNYQVGLQTQLMYHF